MSVLGLAAAPVLRYSVRVIASVSHSDRHRVAGCPERLGLGDERQLERSVDD